MFDLTNWRKLITKELEKQGETWESVVFSTLSPTELVEAFDCGIGGENGRAFTVWTKKRVYFPVCYDGSEWCASVSRKIDRKPTDHIGG
jgi:hypothetical protein